MQNQYKKIVIIGATSCIAEHCARLWIKEGPAHLILVGRNRDKIEKIAADLRVRSSQSLITILETDFINPVSIRSVVDNIVAEGPVDIALIAHGSLPDQTMCQNNLSTTFDALTINGVSPALFAEAFAGHMEKANAGVLAVISSVAGERGRRSNYVYGAAKSLLTHYVQGLQHRLAHTNVKLTLIKPGPTNTPMTAHFKNQQRFASVEHVSELIVKGIHQGKAVIYAPQKWWFFMMIIRCLPGFIFNKMDI